MAIKIQLRRDTAANWAAANPVLAQGEGGLETDTKFIKWGDGVLAWNNLPYQSTQPHAAQHASAGSDPITIAPSQVTGTTIVNNDSRLSDARTPTAHAASHGSGQSDAITIAQSQVTNLTTDLSAKAPLVSPSLTGTPTAPTASASVNSTQIATTAYTTTGISTHAALTSTHGVSGAIVGTTDTQTLTAKILDNNVLKSPREDITTSETAAAGTINFDAKSQGILYYTTSASANWTLNVRGDGSTTLNNTMATGESISIVFMATQGATAYYQTAFQIDGASVTPKWQYGIAPTSGNINSIDVYSFTIVKTGNATFVVLGSASKFA